MPRVFKLGPYLVYFWSDECQPLEPVHVHISEGVPEREATKVWLTENGGAVVCHNQSSIPEHTLRNIIDAIEARHEDIVARWKKHFGEASFYL